MRVNVILLRPKKYDNKIAYFALKLISGGFPTKCSIHINLRFGTSEPEITRKSCRLFLCSLLLAGIQLQIMLLIHLKDVWVQISHKTLCVTLGFCFYTHILLEHFMSSTRCLRVRICHQHLCVLWVILTSECVVIFWLNIPLNPFPRNL